MIGFVGNGQRLFRYSGYISARTRIFEDMILIINGPNLNWVGKREPEVYGEESLEAYLTGFGDTVSVVFTNIEGEIINFLQSAEDNTSIKGIILNAGGYSHTSVAIADTIRAMEKPVVAVHISNTFNRESERHKDLIAAACIGFVGGFGLQSYDIAVYSLRSHVTPFARMGF